MPVRGILKDYNTISKLLFFIGITLVCSGVFGYLAKLVTYLIYGVELDLATLKELDIASLSTINAIKLHQAIQSIGMFWIGVACFVYLAVEKPFQFLKTTQAVSFREMFLVVILLLAAFPSVNWLIEFNQNIALPEAFSLIEEKMKDLEELADGITKALLNMNSFSSLFLNMLVIAVIPAIGEELVFRGVIQQLASKLFNKHVAIIVTSLLFALVHLQFYGFLPRMFLGLLFGYLFYFSGSIWMSIWAHFFHNGLQVILYYLYLKNIIDVNIDRDIDMPGWYAVVSFVLIIAIFITYRSFKRESVE